MAHWLWGCSTQTGAYQPPWCAITVEGAAYAAQKMARMKIANFGTIPSQPSWMWSAPKVNHFQRSMQWLSAINFAKIHKLVFEICCLQKIDYKETHRHTDATEYIISRMAGSW